MKRTRISRLVLLALLGGEFGWAIDFLLLEMNLGLLPIGWGSVVAVTLPAAGLGIWGWMIAPRLPKPGKDEKGNPIVLRAKDPLPPLVAARTLAVAMAAARVGALLCGFYFGLMVLAMSRPELAISARHALVSGVTAAGSLALAAVGVWVERMCTLPPLPPQAAGQPA